MSLWPKLENMLLTRGDGTLYLMQYADGGYPIIYVDKKNGVFCAECAIKEFMQFIDGDIDNPNIVCDTHLEGSPAFCCECNLEMEAAYGDPEENEVLEAISDLTRHNDCTSQVSGTEWYVLYCNPYDQKHWLVSDTDTLRTIRDLIAASNPHFWDNTPKTCLECITLENVCSAITTLANKGN